MQYDPIDLRLFLMTVEAGSITAGAAAAHMTLSAASARIRGLEARLGLALLERAARGVSPTPAGEALARHARGVLGQLERMHADLMRYSRKVGGRVRLLANTVASSEFLPAALARFLAAHPEVDVELEERRSEDITRAIASGSADLGIVSDAVAPVALELLDFRDDRLVLVAPPGHALAAQARCGFAQALAHDFVGLAREAPLQQFLLDRAQQAGTDPRIRARVRDFDGVCELVRAGVGLAVVPQAAARRRPPRDELKVIALSDRWARRALKVCARSMEALPPQARALAAALCSDGAAAAEA